MSQRPHKHPRRRLREQPISRLFPNMITIAGLCCGLSAIRFALLERWEVAVIFILAAALIDGMDGRVARMLGATSEFGAQLDSLSDFVCFGVAPALVLYMWLLQDIKGIGWAVVLFFAVCTALRLARFNTALFEDQKRPWENQFFVGVPSPAGGLLSLLPLIINLQSEHVFTFPPIIVAMYVVLVGALMASRIPTFSGKNIRIKHEMIPHFMIGCSVLLVIFMIESWMLLSILSIAYMLSIPISIRYWRKLHRDSVKSSN
ncbi:MAG: CDP-diacylglycerol--serine O-phosphatidyltransferase [Rickettsiales bacterium]|nr:CDP-diacylglycerol--serine O-phosphatidyltransferase [Rickettsiales bacterium]